METNQSGANQNRNKNDNLSLRSLCRLTCSRRPKEPFPEALEPNKFENNKNNTAINFNCPRLESRRAHIQLHTKEESRFSQRTEEEQ